MSDETVIPTLTEEVPAAVAVEAVAVEPVEPQPEPKKRGRPRKVVIQRGADPLPNGEETMEVEVEVEVIEDPKAGEPDESLGDYVARLEGMRTDAVLTFVSHPAAGAGYYEGKYGGIALANGPKAARWSDGAES